ncbi:MAG: YihY/virulence factor BrkB family protein [Clostridiales bacterium]|nr:YihY/virulence factor BrkB family protein [Clostridiales bacterium]
MQKYKELGLKTLKYFNEGEMTVYSGNATLFIITAAFPFIMLIIAIVNMLPGYSPKDVAEIFFKILPDLDSLKELVEAMIVNLKNQSGGILAGIAALTTLWSASQGVAAIQAGLNKLDGTQTGKGILNIIKRLVCTLLLVVLFPALLVFEVLGESIKGVINNIMERIGLESIDSQLSSILDLSFIIIILAALVVILFIYAYLPAQRHSLKSMLPGTIFCVVGWIVFTELFAFFIPRFYHASSLYGSLASLFLALLWIRIIIMILFFGGALNKALQDKQ